MGSGRWSTDVYSEADKARKAAGKSAFDYDATMKSSSPRTDWKAHPSLDPFGVTMRESRDSAEHPTSLAISVLFDVTGSMRDIPVTLQKKLPELLGLLLRKGYVQDPQILFGAIGDATCDRVPLQIGQFESDNRMDDHLGNLVLEGGGGGQMTESYELAMYFIARHTSIDCWEKRQKRGYLFIIGDEMAYSTVKGLEVERVISDKLPGNIPVKKMLTELNERYNVFYILPSGASHGGDESILKFWRALLGQNVLELDNPAAVCETIALTIGICEGTIDLSDGVEDLKDIGVGDGTIHTVESALAVLPAKKISITGSDRLPGAPSDGGKPTRRL